MHKLSNITLKVTEKIALIGNFATMLNAGIPILEIVDSLLEDSKGNVKKILDVLKEDLGQGRPVNVSFAKFPKVFDKVTVNIIKASEETGTLGMTLIDLKLNIQKEMEFNDKIKTALVYPIFILGVFFAVLLFILTFVIPKVASVFTQLRIALPLPTVIMVEVSKVIIGYPLIVAGGVLVLIVLIALLFRAKRSKVLDIIFSLPIFSEIIKQIDLTRFSRSMYLLLNSGLPVVDSLELTKDVVIKRRMLNVIKNTKDMMLSGKSLAEGLRASKGYVPILMIKLVEAGEKTGTLDKSMQDISEYYDYQVSGSLKILTSLLEPVMLVVIGIVIGGMMLSIIAPIYGLVGRLGTR